MNADKLIKFLTVVISMEAKASSEGADRAINKFGWAAIILAVGISISLGIAAASGLIIYHLSSQPEVQTEKPVRPSR